MSLTKTLKQLPNKALHSTKHTYYVATASVAEFLVQQVDLVSRIVSGKLGDDQGVVTYALESLRYIKYLPEVTFVANFAAGFSKIIKINDPEQKAYELAHHVAEYAVHGSEIAATRVAISYGLDPKVFAPIFMGVDMLASGKDSFIEGIQDAIADAICATHIVGNCGNYTDHDS